MRIANYLVAAATSVALVASPAVAASQAPARTNSSFAVDARAGAVSDVDSDLFRGRKKRRGGALVFILIAVVIAIGIYIVVDDKNDNPASP